MGIGEFAKMLNSPLNLREIYVVQRKQKKALTVCKKTRKSQLRGVTWMTSQHKHLATVKQKRQDFSFMVQRDEM